MKEKKKGYEKVAGKTVENVTSKTLKAEDP